MSSAVPQAPVRNRPFYMDISTFQVENELFRIPTGYLKQYSATFNQMFTLNRQPGAEAVGQSDENPIKLDGVSKVDFEQFLAVVVKYEVEPRKTFDTSHWLSALKLANLWGFSDLRQTAITKLSLNEPRRTFTAMDRLYYGRLHKVEQWVEQGYTELVDRREKISEAEAERIGWKTSLKLCHLREDFHGPPKTATTNSSVPSATQSFFFSSSSSGSLFQNTPTSSPSTSASPQFRGFGSTSSNPSFGLAFGAPPAKKEPPAPPPPAVTSTSAVRQAFSAELQEIREAGAALNVPAPRVPTSQVQRSAPVVLGAK